MKFLRQLYHNQVGAPAVEFAFGVPVLLIFIIGTIQLGILFSSYSGMTSAVNEAARYATTYPAPTDAEILQRMRSKQFMLQPQNITIPTPSRGSAYGVPYVDLTITYTVPLNFIFFSTPPVTLQQTRRAYLN